MTMRIPTEGHQANKTTRPSDERRLHGFGYCVGESVFAGSGAIIRFFGTWLAVILAHSQTGADQVEKNDGHFEVPFGAAGVFHGFGIFWPGVFWPPSCD